MRRKPATVAGAGRSDAGSETNTAEIYDPILDLWTEITGPSGWTRIGDAACCVLPDGRLLLGQIDDTRTSIYDPVTETWTAGPDKEDRSSEETWTLLPDQTVLTLECAGHPRAEKYVAPANTWVSAGSSPVDLVEASSIEIGPAFLLPDGRVFAVGATNHTALYAMPPIANQPGTWFAGPDFPNDPTGQTLGAKDAPGCLMPNGKVLCVAGPVDGESGHYLGPTSFFEFDGATLQRVPDPPNATNVPFVGRMMLTPNGKVLFAAGTNAIYAYTPDGGPDPAWKPHITASPSVLHPFTTYTLFGRQFNGLSQAVGYGDDASSATNYPLVRIRHLASGQVFFCHTMDHSSMGVATGLTTQSTNFQVPFFCPPGPAELCLVANGIASDCVWVEIRGWRIHWPFEEAIVNRLIGSLADGPLWVLGPHGPIPVDPMAKDEVTRRIAKEAQQVRKRLSESVKSLQALGKEAAEHRAAVARAVPPVRDPDLDEIAALRAGGKPTREPAAAGTLVEA